MGQFTVTYPGDKAQLINKIRNMVGNKGTVAGNEQQGSFQGDSPVGTFEGTYTITGDDINVNITKKPFLISTGMIKDEFEKALKKA